jgi:hypothetical protein
MESKKILSLPTSEKKIYRQILAFMNFILQATNQELDVLAEIIKMNNEYEALPNPKRAKFILSTDMRKEMREYLDIEEKQYNGVIAKLKKKLFQGTPILDDDGILHPGLVFKPSLDGFKIEVNFVQTQLKTPTTITTKTPVKEDENISVVTTVPIDKKEPSSKPADQEEPVYEPEFNFTINEPESSR